LLKLYVGTINALLYVPVMQQHIGVCVYVVSLAGKSVGQGYNIYTYTHTPICCCITGTYNNAFIF